VFSLDISKLIPNRFYFYLAPLFPGLFFEVSVLLANPELTRGVVGRIETSPSSGHYLAVLIGLFLAFVLGFGALMFVTLLAWLQNYLRRFLAFSWRHGASVVLRLFSWLSKKRVSWQKHHSLVILNHYVASQVSPINQGYEQARHCWGALAPELLTRKYGLDALELGRLNDDDWQALYWTLAMPPREELTASIMILASHAAGWCGIAAIHFAPALADRWYVGFSLLLIVNGLIYNYYDSKRRGTPEGRAYMNLRALLRQFPQTGEKPQPE
jgi:hypothetical protein